MKTWKISLAWAAYPFLVLLSAFGLLAAVNWGYESKLFSVDRGVSAWSDRHLGPILLGMAMGLALIASFLLFVAHVFWPKNQQNWFLVPLTFITILFVFPGLFIVILGPSALTLVEQMRYAPK